MADIVGGLPDTAQEHAVRELYAYRADNEITNAVVTNLIRSVMRLPNPLPKKTSAANQSSVAGASTRKKIWTQAVEPDHQGLRLYELPSGRSSGLWRQ